ncbi:hypothetical protein V6O07_06265, partial [Arthrospira platensis SPKY2]
MWIDGEAVPLRLTASSADALSGRPLQAIACDGAITLGAGSHDVVTASGALSGVDIDRIVLRSGVELPAVASAPPTAPPSWAVLEDHRTSARIRVDPCPTSCWLIYGQGYSPGWEAAIDGQSLGPPEPVNGGFTGWRL